MSANAKPVRIENPMLTTVIEAGHELAFITSFFTTNTDRVLAHLGLTPDQAERLERAMFNLYGDAEALSQMLEDLH